MTTLSKRLRLGTGSSPDHLLMLKAADLIDVLCAALDQLLNCDCDACFECQCVAKAARFANNTVGKP
jgi:hypothetical protein